MWHVRLLRDDGTVLAEDDIGSFIDVADVAKAHGDLTDAELGRGHTVILELTDPDGLCEPMAIMIEPRSWN